MQSAKSFAILGQRWPSPPNTLLINRSAKRQRHTMASQGSVSMPFNDPGQPQVRPREEEPGSPLAHESVLRQPIRGSPLGRESESESHGTVRRAAASSAAARARNAFRRRPRPIRARRFRRQGMPTGEVRRAPAGQGPSNRFVPALVWRPAVLASRSARCPPAPWGRRTVMPSA